MNQFALSLYDTVVQPLFFQASVQLEVFTQKIDKTAGNLKPCQLLAASIALTGATSFLRYQVQATNWQGVFSSFYRKLPWVAKKIEKSEDCFQELFMKSLGLEKLSKKESIDEALALSFLTQHFHADPAYAFFTATARESSLLVCKSAMQKARERGVINPKILLAKTADSSYAHPDMAAFLDFLDLDDKQNIDIKKLEKKLTASVALIVLSYPNHYGACDPVKKIASLMREKQSKAQLHLDQRRAFLLTEFEKSSPNFLDDSITSIQSSLPGDFSSEGLSLLMYRNGNALCLQPSTSFVTPSLHFRLSQAPSKTVLMKVLKAFADKEALRGLYKAYQKELGLLKDLLSEQDYLTFLGQARLSYFAFVAKSDTYALAGYLSSKGWPITYLQKPEAFQLNTLKLLIEGKHSFARELMKDVEEFSKNEQFSYLAEFFSEMNALPSDRLVYSLREQSLRSIDRFNLQFN